VIDPYQLWVTGDAPGVCISGWQLHHNFIPRWATPRSAVRELRALFGPAPHLDDVAGERTAKGLLLMRACLLAGPARAADATLHLLTGQDHDLVWVTFIGAHLAGHQLWDLSAIDGDGSAEERALLESALEEVYVEVDRAIGRIVEALPDDADVIVFSSLGMGPQTSRSDLLPDMLQAVLRGGPRTPSGDQGAGSSIWRIRAALPAGLRAAVARALPGDAIRALVARLYLRGVDWSDTPAFVLPGDHFGNIRLNIRGRERDGSLAPGEAGALLDVICDGLATFEDIGGGPSIESIARPRNPSSGPKWEMMPDLVVRWSDRPSVRLKGVRSPVFGEVARRAAGTGRSGNHAPGAWLLLAPARATVVERSGVPRIVDLAATACSLLGGDPEGLAGSPLLERPGRA
jgi:predicted AlkP superfamily phosphohydrolase/phosphomutase